MDVKRVLQPYDSYNQVLESHVHPLDWTNPQPAGKYNLVVIGAGTAGLVSAAGAAGLGAKVAIIERGLMGGDCLNVGCVPSKAVIRAARVAATLRDSPAFGFQLKDGWQFDFAAAMERMRRLRAEISPHDSARRFQQLGIDVFLGQGRFISPNQVEVGDATLSFSRAVIATGARAAAPPIPGLDEAGFLTNESVFSLTELPRRLAVIGGGPIGCELAQCFARFGSSVYQFEQAAHVLSREDADAAEVIQSSLKRDGVAVHLHSTVTAVETRNTQTAAEKVIHFECNGQTGEVVVDQVLVAIGRAPNVKDLGLEQAEVEFDERRGVRVDPYLRTTNSRIFAAGDVCSSLRFTHAADFMARLVIRNALFKGSAKVSSLTIPWCTYTAPELAHVGLGERDAGNQGIAIDSFRQPMSGVDRAILDGETEGFVKIHVKQGTDQIVGATIVAPHAGDMIGELSMAMTCGIGLKQLANVIHPYPTQAEAIRKVGDQYNRTRLTPRIKKLFETWLRWTR